jgi:hypothetical protein
VQGRAVRLVADGTTRGFVVGHLTVDSVTLWIDAA